MCFAHSWYSFIQPILSVSSPPPIILGITELPFQLFRDLMGGVLQISSYWEGGWEFPGRLSATYNESFHCTSRNRADARPTRDLEHEARSGSKELRGGTSLLLLPTLLPSTHVMLYVALGLAMRCCFLSLLIAGLECPLVPIAGVLKRFYFLWGRDLMLGSGTLSQVARYIWGNNC